MSSKNMFSPIVTELLINDEECISCRAPKESDVKQWIAVITYSENLNVTINGSNNPSARVFNSDEKLYFIKNNNAHNQKIIIQFFPVLG
jgi:hypothetical protein